MNVHRAKESAVGDGHAGAVPVEIIILQLVSHGPLIIIFKVHHHGQHLGHWK